MSCSPDPAIDDHRQIFTIFDPIGSFLLKSVHFKKTVARILLLSKLWHFLVWFVLKVPQLWKKRDSHNCLLKMNRLYHPSANLTNFCHFFLFLAEQFNLQKCQYLATVQWLKFVFNILWTKMWNCFVKIPEKWDVRFLLDPSNPPKIGHH